MSIHNEHLKKVEENITNQGRSESFCKLSKEWMVESVRNNYSYNFSWMGRPIIQYPQDMIVTQELVFQVKPDLIIETGIAHGGSLVYSASLLELLGGDGMVLGIDIDIRQHNREAIEAHPMSKRIKMIQGSSISDEVKNQVYEFAKNKKRILVMLDSNHTYEHVLEELKIYSPLVKKGSYLMVFDSVIDDLPNDLFVDRPWGEGNGPQKSVFEFLKTNKRFEIDKKVDNKIMISVAPNGYLKCIEDGK
ncbi:MAG: cephalosporin hydroxylase family protein [Bacteriovorax sp.]|nr:cephalosporin hydroxylase family protein [Bacteriovorax sp.]